MIQSAFRQLFGVLIVFSLTLGHSSAPAHALFVQPDTLDPTLPGVGTNRYAYAQGDPINKADPNGHAAFAVPALAAWACAGGGCEAIAVGIGTAIFGAGIGTAIGLAIFGSPLNNDEAPKAPGIKSGNPDLDRIFGSAVQTDKGSKGYEVKGRQEDYEEKLRDLPEATQKPHDNGGTTTILGDGTKVDTYGGRSSTPYPGWAVTHPGEKRSSIKGSFVQEDENEKPSTTTTSNNHDNSSSDGSNGTDHISDDMGKIQ